MTRQQFNPDEVRELCEQATPGPWEVDEVDGRSVRDSTGEFVVASVAARKEWPTRANAAFIAAARELVPALADEVEQLRAELDRATERANRNARLAADNADERDTATDRERERIADWFAAEADHWRIKNNTEARCEYDRAAQMVRDLDPGGVR